MVPQTLIEEGPGPIAISFLPSGTLAVLGGRGRISLIDMDSGKVTQLKDTLGFFFPANIAAVRLGDTDSIFVTLYSSAMQQGVLARYSVAGDQVQTWTALRRIYDGIAIDPVHHTAYLGDALTGEISSLSMDKASTSPSFLVGVPGVARLGPLAMDAAGRRLFAADVARGTIYTVDLATRKSHVLAYGTGEPAALSYDGDQQKLYVADASRRKIWQIATNSPNPKASIFSSARQLREPRGITVDAQHAVWVADYAAMAVFKLSPTGQVVQRISP
jgi:sugar lactone lactonase YvrE